MSAPTQSQGTCPDNTPSSNQVQTPEGWVGIFEKFLENIGKFRVCEAGELRQELSLCESKICIVICLLPVTKRSEKNKTEDRYGRDQVKYELLLQVRVLRMDGHGLSPIQETEGI